MKANNGASSNQPTVLTNGQKLSDVASLSGVSFNLRSSNRGWYLYLCYKGKEYATNVSEDELFLTKSGESKIDKRIEKLLDSVSSSTPIELSPEDFTKDAKVVIWDF